MNGIISVIKPPGMTSHDVVSHIRKQSGIKKVGHTGTLDPGAAGVLPICIGKSTKVVDFLMNDRKTYICELTLGNKTDTYDKYGEFIFDSDKEYSNVTPEMFSSVLNKFKGEITQTPPSYSAIKINGVRAYDLARKGIDIDIPKRRVMIYNISMLKYDLPRIMLEIECSKGTYIRSICNDIGEELGCGGYMSFLLRSATGAFNISNSYMLFEITRETIENLIVSPAKAIDFKNVYLSEKLEKKVLNGNQVKVENNGEYRENELVKVFISPNKFVAIGKVNKDILSIEKLLI